MTTSKKPSGNAKTRSSTSSSQVSLKKVKGENFYRNAKQVGRLKMLNGGKAVRDKDGKIIQAAAFQKGEDETKPGRVQPDRRWFGMHVTSMVINYILRIPQVIPGSFLRLRWTISVQVLPESNMTPTRSCFDGTSYPWLFWTMLQTLTCARYVCMVHYWLSLANSYCSSVHTLWKPSLSKILSVPKLSGRNPVWTLVPLRSWANSEPMHTIKQKLQLTR